MGNEDEVQLSGCDKRGVGDSDESTNLVFNGLVLIPSHGASAKVRVWAFQIRPESKD